MVTITITRYGKNNVDEYYLYTLHLGRLILLLFYPTIYFNINGSIIPLPSLMTLTCYLKPEYDLSYPSCLLEADFRPPLNVK